LIYIIDTKQGQHKKYQLKIETDIEPTFNDVLNFVENWKLGTLKPVYKSEPDPETPFERGVRLLTANNFDELVIDTTKDFLVLFYAPWCRHSRKLLE
jgi:protein disulfide-isomerase A1